MIKLAVSTSLLLAAVAVAQPTPQTAAQRVAAHFQSVNRNVLAMAKDFPADKYDFRVTKEMRSFGEIIVHIASGNVYAAKAIKDEKANWDELDPKNYKTKADIVALMQRSIDDANAQLKVSPEGPKKDFEPWLVVMEHAAEHYGLLAAYYRSNGLMPPQSRPKK